MKRSLHLTFYDMNDGTLVTDLWVIEDLVIFYPLEESVKSNFKKTKSKSFEFHFFLYVFCENNLRFSNTRKAIQITFAFFWLLCLK